MSLIGASIFLLFLLGSVAGVGAAMLNLRNQGRLPKDRERSRYESLWSQLQASAYLQLPRPIIAWSIRQELRLGNVIFSIAERAFSTRIYLVLGLLTLVTFGILCFSGHGWAAALVWPLLMFSLLFDDLAILLRVLTVAQPLYIAIQILAYALARPIHIAAIIVLAALPMLVLSASFLLARMPDKPDQRHVTPSGTQLPQPDISRSRAMVGTSAVLSFAITLAALWLGSAIVPDAPIPQTFQLLAMNVICDGLTVYATYALLRWALDPGDLDPMSVLLVALLCCPLVAVGLGLAWSLAAWSLPLLTALATHRLARWGLRKASRLPAIRAHRFAILGAVVLDVIIAAALAVLSLFGSLLGTPYGLSLTSVARVLVGLSPTQTRLELGPYFWVMHTTFLPTLFYCISLLVAWFCKLVLLPANWVLNRARNVENPHPFAAAALALVAVACGAGVTGLRMLEGDKRGPGTESPTPSNIGHAAERTAPVTADPNQHTLVISRPSLVGAGLSIFVRSQAHGVAVLNANDVLRIHFPSGPARVTLEAPGSVVSLRASWTTSDPAYYVRCSVNSGLLVGHVSFSAQGTADDDTAQLIRAGKVRDLWFTHPTPAAPAPPTQLDQLATWLSPIPQRTAIELPFAIEWEKYKAARD
jgi:hypothetical protein